MLQSISSFFFPLLVDKSKYIFSQTPLHLYVNMYKDLYQHTYLYLYLSIHFQIYSSSYLQPWALHKYLQLQSD